MGNQKFQYSAPTFALVIIWNEKFLFEKSKQFEFVKKLWYFMGWMDNKRYPSHSSFLSVQDDCNLTDNINKLLMAKY